MDRATRWLWAGWGLSILLGFLAPWRRAILATPGSGSLLIYAAVGVMVAVMLLARKRPMSFFSALLMSVAGLALGSALAFLTLYLLIHKPIQVALGGKWLFFGALLTFSFVRQMRMAVTPVPEFELPSLEGMSVEEARATLKAHIDGLIEESKLIRRRATWILGLSAILLLRGAALLGFLQVRHALSAVQQSFILTLVGTMSLLSGAGLWRFRPLRVVKSSSRT